MGTLSIVTLHLNVHEKIVQNKEMKIFYHFISLKIYRYLMSIKTEICVYEFKMLEIHVSCTFSVPQGVPSRGGARFVLHILFPRSLGPEHHNMAHGCPKNQTVVRIRYIARGSVYKITTMKCIFITCTLKTVILEKCYTFISIELLYVQLDRQLKRSITRT